MTTPKFTPVQCYYGLADLKWVPTTIFVPVSDRPEFSGEEWIKSMAVAMLTDELKKSSIHYTFLGVLRILPVINEGEKPAEIPRSILIIGRRWFRKSAGNTYFSAQVFVNGDLVHEIDYASGYGDHYIDVCSDWLEANGYMPDRRHSPNGSKEPLWAWARDRHNIHYHYHVTDVDRKSDLAF